MSRKLISERQVSADPHVTYLRLPSVKGPHARPSLSVCTVFPCSAPNCGEAGIGDDEDADIGTCSSTISEQVFVSSLVQNIMCAEQSYHI